MKVQSKKDYRVRRHLRLRNKIVGTADRPRMAVFVSNMNMYVQFIDDEEGRTLASASTMQGELKGTGKPTREQAAKLGKIAAEQAKSVGIKSVVFDRGGFSYSARMKTLADAARETGLEF